LASLIAFFRASPISLVDTYSQFLTASLKVLGSSNTASPDVQAIIRNFILGRVGFQSVGIYLTFTLTTAPAFDQEH
jgi:hypothetical protein